MTAKKQVARAPITLRAVMQRVNRLHKRAFEQGEDNRWLKVRATRGAALLREFGAFHVIDLAHNRILPHKNLDVEQWARDCGALNDYEYLVEEDR